MSDVYSKLLHRFHACPVQQTAYSILCEELLSGDLVWTGDVSGGERYERVIPTTALEHEVWSRFVRRLVHEIVVYGFAVYRLIRVREEKHSAQERRGTGGGRAQRGEDGGVQPVYLDVEVMNGELLEIVWDSDGKTWDVVFRDSTAKGKRGGWHLLVFDEPWKHGPGEEAVLNSCCARTYSQSLMLRQLSENVRYRDYVNSNAVAFTRMSKSFLTPSGRPQFDQPTMPGVLNSSSTDTFSNWLATTVDTVKRIEQLNDATRAVARKAYSATARPGDKGGGGVYRRGDSGAALRPTIPHFELPINAERDQTELSYRRGPEDLESVMKQLRHEIYFMWNVPPQIRGENVNSERLAGSDRLSQMGIARFHNYMKRLRSKVQVALRKLSSTAYGRRDVYVRLWPCIGTYNLQQLTPILTDKAARKLYA